MIQEFVVDDDDNVQSKPIWNILSESTGENLTFSVTNDQKLALNDDGGNLWSYSDLLSTLNPTVNSSDLTSNMKSEASNLVWTVNSGVIIAFTTFNGIAFLDAKKVRPNDYFQSGAILKAMFGVLDVVSDFIFSLTVTEKHFADNTVPFFIPVICWSTITVPVLLSLLQLTRRSRTIWLEEDVTLQWMTRFSFILYILPFCCGSAFVAVALLNSNAFRLGVFSMGLSRAELSRFSMQKVWSIILFEVSAICNL